MLITCMVFKYDRFICVEEVTTVETNTERVVLCRIRDYFAQWIDSDLLAALTH